MSDDEKPAASGKEKKKKGISPVVLVLLLLVGLGGGLAISKVTGGGASGPTTEPPPEPGEVAVIDSINVNLAGGHFLRIGMGAQLTKEVTVKPEEWAKTEGAIVRDVLIEVFSGKDMAELQTGEGRKQHVQEVKEKVIEATEKKVMNVYLTEYVMQ